MSDTTHPPPSLPPVTPAPAQPAATLTYDRHNPQADRGGVRVVLWFWFGLFAAAIPYGVVWALMERSAEGFDVALSRALDPILFPLMSASLMLAPATLSLGLAMWARRKLIKEIRYARTLTAIVSGIVCGLYPFALLRFLPDRWTVPLLWGLLGWAILFPIAAGFWLCYRSHLRD